MEKYRRRWQDNIGMDLKKHRVHRICLFQKRGQWRAASVTVTHSNSKRDEEFLDKLNGP
jgi:TnpA family transposase